MNRFLLSITASLFAFGAAPVQAEGLKTPPVIPDRICAADEVQTISQVEVSLPTQDYEPTPAMWKIADEDTVIYLFGTYHLLPEGFEWRTPAFDEIAANVDEIVFESREDDTSEEGLTQQFAQMARLREIIMEYTPDKPLSERLSKHNRFKFRRILETLEVQPERIERAPPMLIMFMMAMATSRAQGLQSDLGVESVLEAEFVASERPISAIEDPIAVMENLIRIDEHKLVSEIDKGLDEWDGCDTTEGMGDPDWTTLHSWAQGDLDDSFTQEMLSDPLGRAIYDVLLVDRNRAWSDWVDERLEQPGNLMLAVGAGHMEGDDSLVLLLEERGITVERIQ